jgi:hypothetical protein
MNCKSSQPACEGNQRKKPSYVSLWSEVLGSTLPISVVTKPHLACAVYLGLRFHEKDILHFMRTHPREINLGKVEPTWFWDLILLRGAEIARPEAP